MTNIMRVLLLGLFITVSTGCTQLEEWFENEATQISKTLGEEAARAYLAELNLDPPSSTSSTFTEDVLEEVKAEGGYLENISPKLFPEATGEYRKSAVGYPGIGNITYSDVSGNRVYTLRSTATGEDIRCTVSTPSYIDYERIVNMVENSTLGTSIEFYGKIHSFQAQLAGCLLGSMFKYTSPVYATRVTDTLSISLTTGADTNQLSVYMRKFQGILAYHTPGLPITGDNDVFCVFDLGETTQEDIESGQFTVQILTQDKCVINPE